jgi:cobalt-zinc-cadmium efflux system outer membrane protein
MLDSTRAALLAGALLVASQSAHAETVTLEQAVAKASEATPLLSAGDAAIAAARAGRVQAGVRPNPSVTLQSENFVGTGPYNVLGQAEITATYNQPIERGGKRAARVAFAQQDINVAEASARIVRLNLAAAVQRAYIDVQIADYAARISGERLETEAQMQREALRRVRGYKDPLFVETRAAARVAQARLARDEAQARLANARNHLASFWAGSGGDLQLADKLTLPNSSAQTIAAADQALREAEIARARAGVVVEQSKAAQDYTLSGGARYLRGTGDVALVAGVTIPLGRFDRNQGNIERAQAERQRLEFLAEADRLDRLRRLASLRADADAARTRADAIMAEVYPRTVRTLDQVREGYNRGGFTFRDVQDAADAIVSVQEQWLDAITRFRDAQTEIDRLTGRFDADQPVETMP